MDSVKNYKHIVFCKDHYNPLGVVRSLGEEGIAPIVILCDEGKTHLINRSKYLGKFHHVKSLEEGYRLLLSVYGNEDLKPFVYTCSDDMESYLDLHYDELIGHFYFFNASMAQSTFNQHTLFSISQFTFFQFLCHNFFSSGSPASIFNKGHISFLEISFN